MGQGLKKTEAFSLRENYSDKSSLKEIFSTRNQQFGKNLPKSNEIKMNLDFEGLKILPFIHGRAPPMRRIFFILFLFLNFFGVWLIYNVVLVSAIQQSELVTHTHISTLF